MVHSHSQLEARCATVLILECMHRMFWLLLLVVVVVLHLGMSPEDLAS